MILIRNQKGSLLLPIRATPKGSVNMVMPWRAGDERIQIKVSPPPEGGKANKAVIEVLAKALGVPKRDIAVVSGETSRLKTLSVSYDEPEYLLQSLAAAIGIAVVEDALRISP